MELKILVTYAGQYDMTNEKGEQVCGTTVNYFFVSDDMREFVTRDVTNDKGDKVGTNRSKVSLALNDFFKFKKMPAIYNGSFEMSIGSDGKPVLKLVDVDYLADIEMKMKSSPVAK